MAKWARKQMTAYDWNEMCELSEKLEKLSMDDLEFIDNTTVKKEAGYEWGFIDEHPYVLEKATNQCVVSYMGKRYNESIDFDEN